MKKVIILMTILMGLCMSFALSLVGTLMSGHFTVPSWLMSFGISFGLSLIIGFLVPIKKLGDKACEKKNIPVQSLKGTMISAAISDAIYTPIITVIMVVVMMSNAQKHLPEGATLPPLPVAILSSLAVCLVVGFIVIVLIQPPLIKFLTRNMKRPENMPPNK